MTKKKSNKQSPLEKIYTNSQELIKQVWIPIAGIIGAIFLVNQLVEIWNGNSTRVNYITFWVLTAIWLMALVMATFGKNIQGREGFFGRKVKFRNKNILIYKLISGSLLALSVIAIISGITIFKNEETRLAKAQKDKIVIVIAAFDGPENQYGIRNQIVEQLHSDLRGFKEIEIITPEDLVTTEQGSEHARQLGKQYLADVVIWGWYRPTENPNITLHIENLNQTFINVLEKSNTYKPDATLADLESFEIQQKLGIEFQGLALFLLGFVQYQAGDYSNALVSFDQVFNQDNSTNNIIDQSNVYFYAANSHANLGEYGKAIQTYDWAIESDPQFVVAYNNRGIFYFFMQEYNKAVADYNQAIQLDSQYFPSYDNRGVVYFTLHEYDKALNDYNQAIQLYSNNPYTYYHRGEVYSALYEYEKAINNFTQAIQLAPDVAYIYNSRGSAYSGLEQYDKAIADFTQAIQIDPYYTEARSNRGIAYTYIKQYDKAIADHNLAIQYDVGNASAYYSRGTTYSLLQQYDKAITDYSLAIQFDAEFSPAYNNRCEAYLNIEEFVKAVADCTLGIQLDPQNVFPYNNRGVAYFKLGQYDKAIADCNQAIQLDPNFAMAYNNRGFYYDYLLQYDKAIADFNKAIQLNPRLAIAYENRGFAYQTIGKQVEAEADFKKYKELTGQP